MFSLMSDYLRDVLPVSYHLRNLGSLEGRDVSSQAFKVKVEVSPPVPHRKSFFENNPLPTVGEG